MSQIDALLRFYFKIDPDALDDDDWAKRWGELKFALEFENKRWEEKSSQNMM